MKKSVLGVGAGNCTDDAALDVQLRRPVEAKPLLTDALQLAIDQQHEDPERELRSLLSEI